MKLLVLFSCLVLSIEGFSQNLDWEIFKNKTSYNFNLLKSADSIPDQIIKLDSLTTNNNSTLVDHFSSRIRGYLIPPVSGIYSFYFACDDKGEFWLSTDTASANAQLKSKIDSIQTDWTKNISSQSLVAGQKYFFEIMHYDSVYTDLVKLGWIIPGTSSPIAIKSTYVTSSGDNVPINKLLFPDNSITAFPNWTITPRYQILPWNTSNKEIQWTSSNPSVATVDTKGIIHTLSFGECQITGKSAGNPSITSTLILTVTDFYGPYFVKPNGIGKGKTWEDATSLTGLLNLLNQGTLSQKINIYLAEGVYKPTNTNDRNMSFVVNSLKAIRMLGGYDSASSGKDSTKRDIVKNETILSGDIGVQGENIDNSYHVLTLINSAIVDGITICDGRASCSTYGWTPGTYFFKPDDNGGGIYISSNRNYASTIYINNCKIINNSAWNSGGGMFIRGAWDEKKLNIYINECDISSNLIQQQTINTGGIFDIVVNGNGGGIFNAGGELFVNNSIFYNNSTGYGYGKAIMVTNGVVTIDRCSFYNNIGYYEDLWAKDAATLNLNNSTVFGSIVSYFLSTANIKSSTIIGKGYAGGYGAKINLDNSIWTNGNLSEVKDTSLISVKFSIINNNLYGISKYNIISDKIPLFSLWLDSIANNGGLTPTVKLKDLPDNLAISKGNPLYLGTEDQRGAVRIDSVSIGAYQWVKVSGLSVFPHSMALCAKDSAKLTISVLPAFASDKSFTVTSLDNTIASVTGSKISGISPGKANLIVRSVDGGFVDTCKVEVTGPVGSGAITGSTTVYQGQNSVTYTVPAIPNATSYLWTLPAGATGTSTTNSITVDYGASVGSDRISVIGHNDCGDGAVNELSVLITGLSPLDYSKKITVYPNPVTNEIIIESDGATEKTDFVIVNTAGQVIYTGYLFEKVAVQTTGFAPGLYFIKLKSGKTIGFKKIVKL